MAAEPIDYQAVLADLEARRAQIDAAIAGVKALLGQPVTDGPGPGPKGGSSPEAGDFLGMSIPEAAKKHLATVRKPVSTKGLMDALVAGGLPSSKYNTMYSVLMRRESRVGDIINMKGDWALSEWYPNHPRKTKLAAAKPDAEDETKGKDKDTKAAAH